MKVYLAGPIRGQPNNNRPLFDQVAKQLRGMGHVVLNPLEMDDLYNNHPDNPDFSIRKALAIDTKWICEECELLVCLPGWETSRGARMEHALATALGIEFVIGMQYHCSTTDHRIT